MTPEERLDRYARLAVEVGCNLQPGQLLRGRRAARSPGARARDRRGRLRSSGRSTSRSSTPIRTSGARASCTRREDELDWSPPWTLTPDRRVREGARRVHRDHGRPRARALRRPRPGAGSRRRGPARVAERVLEGDGRRQHRLDDHRLPQRRLGGGGVRRAGRRAPVGGGCRRDAARRGRPGRRLAHAYRAS